MTSQLLPAAGGHSRRTAYLRAVFVVSGIYLVRREVTAVDSEHP